MLINDDLEFYCYLKKTLPMNYQIRAQPSTAYYSEWLFEYNVYKNDILYRQFKGDFRLINKGYLISEANQLLQEILKGE